jgi:Cof subfamily protein (haloacid dehalogenase superfamily)
MPDNIKLIAFDIDGTILNSNKDLTPRTMAAIDKARARGVHIIPATGRQFFDIPIFLKERASPFIIANNGAQIYETKTDRLVFSHTYKKEEALAVLGELRKLRGMIYGAWERTGAIDTKGKGAEEGILEQIASIKRWKTVPRFEDLEEIINTLDKNDETKSFIKLVILFADKAERDKAFAAFRPRKDLYVTYFADDNIEILPAGINKGEALKQTAKTLGTSMENVMAIGDSDNDREMIAEAGLGVAMANAEDDIKACARKITAGCDEDGAAIAIEEALG